MYLQYGEYCAKMQKTISLPEFSTCICISSSVAKWGRQRRRDGRKGGEEKEEKKEKEERRAQKPKTETQNLCLPQDRHLGSRAQDSYAMNVKVGGGGPTRFGFLFWASVPSSPPSPPSPLPPFFHPSFPVSPI